MGRRPVFAQQVSTNISKKTVTPGSRSTRKIASIVKPATSRIRPKTLPVVLKVWGTQLPEYGKIPELILLALDKIMALVLKIRIKATFVHEP